MSLPDSDFIGVYPGLLDAGRCAETIYGKQA